MPIGSNRHVQAGARRGQRQQWPRGILKLQKKKKKKKKKHTAMFGLYVRTEFCFFFFFFFFLAPFGPGAEYISVPAIRARFEHADCYQSARSTRGQTGPTATVAPWHFKCTKKKKKKTTAMIWLYVRTEFCFFFFFFFFFFFLALFGPGSNLPIASNPCLNLALIAGIQNVLLGGLFGNYKVWIMSFHHDKL